MSNKHEFTEQEITQLADRILESQRVQAGTFDLGGDPAPTQKQIAAVVRSLADFTHTRVMVGAKVRNLTNERDHDFGRGWKQAAGLGRYFHALADNILNRS